MLNAPRGFPPGKVVLHRATCDTISVSRPGVPPGGFTQRDCGKICSTGRSALSRWVAAHGRPGGSFSSTE